MKFFGVQLARRPPGCDCPARLKNAVSVATLQWDMATISPLTPETLAGAPTCWMDVLVGPLWGTRKSDICPIGATVAAMNFLYNLVVLVHLLAMATVVGAYAATFKAPRVSEPMVWGARLVFLSGVVIVGLGESVDSLGKDYNMAKIGTKLIIALAVDENGTLVTLILRPDENASASARPTSAISGSVKMAEAALS